MQKNTNGPIKLNPWAFLLVILLFTVVIGFKISADAQITKGIHTSTRELAQRNLKIIYYQIELYEKELELLGRELVSPLDSDENREMLLENMPTNYFDELAVYSLDGAPVLCYNSLKEEADSCIFLNVDLNKRVFADDENIYVIQKIKQNGKSIGSMIGSLSKQEFTRRAQLDNVNQMGFAVLFNIEGIPIIIPSDKSVVTWKDKSIWDSFLNVDFEQGYSYKQFEKNVSQYGLGFIQYKMSDKDRRVAFYTPIGIDDWYILQVATQGAIDLQYAPVRNIMFETLLIFSIVFVLLSYFVWYSNEYHQKKLAIARKQLDQLTNSIRGGVLKFTSNRNGSIEYISSGYLKILGITYDEYLKKYHQSFYQMIWEEDRERVRKALEPKSLYENRELNLDYRLIGKNDEPVWIIDNLRVIVDNDGRYKLYSVIVDATSIKEMENVLRSYNQDLQLITGTHMESRVFEYDLDTGRIHFHEGVFLGYNLTDYDGCTIEDMFGQDWRDADTFAAAQKVRDEIMAGKEFASAIVRLFQGDSDEFSWIRIMLTRITENGKIRILGSMRDVTEEHEVQQRLSREKEKNRMMIADAIFTGTINLSQNSIVINSDHRDIRKNDTISYNYIRRLQMDVATLIHPEDVEVYLSEFNIEALFRHYNRGDITRTVEYRRRATGQEGYIWVRATLKLTKEVSSGDIICFVYINDIDQEIRATEILRQKAEKDYLTGLFNREGLVNRIEAHLSTADPDEICAFYALDLDDFKVLNDTYGHNEGDLFLQMITEQLVHMFRKDDLIGRMGGDEFIVFLKKCPSREFVVKKAEEINRKISEIKMDKHGYSGSVSVGVAIAPFDGTNFQDLYLASDKALYASKQKGKNISSLYNVAEG